MADEKSFLGKLFSGKKKCCCKFEITEDEPQHTETENNEPQTQDNDSERKSTGK